MHRYALRVLVILGLISSFGLVPVYGPATALAAPATTNPDACGRLAVIKRAKPLGIKVKLVAQTLAAYHCQRNPGATKGVPISKVGSKYKFHPGNPCGQPGSKDPPAGKTDAAVAKIQAQCVAEQVELVNFFSRQPKECIQSINLANAGRTAEPTFKSAQAACAAKLRAAGQSSIGLASTSEAKQFASIVHWLILIVCLYFLGQIATRAFLRRWLGPKYGS